MGMDYDAIKKLAASKNINLYELDSLTDTERSILLQILNETHDKGSSMALDSIWYEDYEEVPADIDTFIDDEEYLGKSLGGTIYPYWRQKLREIFAPGAKYFEVIFDCAIGVGKSTIADVGMLYMLHKIMCLKNPTSYYGLTKSSIMTVNFFNVSLNLAYGVTYSKFQSMIQDSPWFMERGTIYGARNLEWAPNQNYKIQLVVGSKARHALGQDVFCLTGDTKIVTNLGISPISNLTNGLCFKVLQYDSLHNYISMSDECKALKVADTSELIEIELEDGTIIKCTPTHRFMLTNGKYKEAQYLTEEDDLMFL